MGGDNGNLSRYSGSTNFDIYGQGILPGLSAAEEAASRHRDPDFRVRPVGRIGTLGAAANLARETSEEIMDRIWAGTKDRLVSPDPGNILPAVD